MASKEICDTTSNIQGNPFVTGRAHLYNGVLYQRRAQHVG
jgi:hypothetical protein